MKYWLLKIRSIPFVALLLGTLALSFAPIFVRWCEMAPSAVTFWRTGLSVPMWALLWLLLPLPQIRNANKPKTKDYVLLLLAGIFFGLDLTIWHSALCYTSVANATLLVNFASLFVALLSWLFLKTSLQLGMAFGMVVALVGSVLLVWPHLNEINDFLLGDGLSLLAAFFYALYLLSIQIARKVFGTISIMITSGVATSVTAYVAAYILGQNMAIDSIAIWKLVFGLALIVQVVGQGLIAFALSDVPAILSSIVLLLQPVLAAAIAWQLFDEKLVLIQVVGMAVVILGIMLAKLSFSKSIDPNNKAVNHYPPKGGSFIKRLQSRLKLKSLVL